MSRTFELQAALPILALAVTGCGQAPNNLSAADPANMTVTEPSQAQAPGQSGRLQSPTNSSAPAPDPKSAAAARLVVVDYAKLIEEGQLSDSRRLWIGGEFGALEAQLKRFDRIKAEVGDPGQMEGAAGSSYVEVPLQLTGQGESGEPLSLTGLVTLRRVNEVPGSTELQRRWHIYGVDLQPRP